MPYELDGNCVKKKDTGETVKCHDTHEKAVAHFRALQANVKDSGVVEMSLRITKASYNKTEDAPRRWAAVDSDIDEDLYAEKMSIELYRDFIKRIENKEPIPDAFKDVICEGDWCGAMPYLSIAHYKSGTQLKNVPGTVESVYVDGTRLKSKGTLSDTPMGRRVFDALVEDLYKKKSGDDQHLPVRISIGFLDLEHKHVSAVGGQEFTFERTAVGQICPLCSQGVGGKIYTKGQLVHLALTRVPANPRTEMNVERSMDEITTKKQDAQSILGEELANELEEKSIANDILVVRSDENGSLPRPDPSELTPCYDPNTGGWNQECINSVMDKYMAQMRDSISTPVKSTTDAKPLLDALWKSVETLYKSNGLESPIMEDAMAKENVEKVSLGGEAVPHKPFEYAGIDGSGNNTVANPVKAAKMEDESPEEDKKGDEKEEKSALDLAFETLKTLVDKSKSAGTVEVDAINNAFASLGTAVEKEFTPKSAPAYDPNDLAAIVKSAVESAVAPLKIQIATLQAQQNQVVQPTGNVVKSKALTIGGYQRPEDMIARAAVNQPTRKLSQIEQIARKSTGLPG